jgi:hypothetical protein
LRTKLFANDSPTDFYLHLLKIGFFGFLSNPTGAGEWRDCVAPKPEESTEFFAKARLRCVLESFRGRLINSFETKAE